MRFTDYIRIAMSNLWKRKLRATLTIFAVVIGTVLVALMVSLGVGLQQYVTGQLTAIRVPGLISVEPKTNQSVGGIFLSASGLGAPQEVQEGQQNPFISLKKFTSKDVERIRAVEHVVSVDPIVIVMASWVQLEGDEKRYQVQLNASPPYEISQRKLIAGRAFQPDERDVAVVAYGYLNVWGIDDPREALGKKITIHVTQGYQMNLFSSKKLEGRDYVFEIVGVFQESLLSTEVAVPLAQGIEIGRYFNEDEEAYTDKDMGYALSVYVDDPKQVDAVAQGLCGRNARGIGQLAGQRFSRHPGRAQCVRVDRPGRRFAGHYQHPDHGHL